MTQHIFVCGNERILIQVQFYQSNKTFYAVCMNLTPNNTFV